MFSFWYTYFMHLLVNTLFLMIQYQVMYGVVVSFNDASLKRFSYTRSFGPLIQTFITQLICMHSPYMSINIHACDQNVSCTIRVIKIHRLSMNVNVNDKL